MRSGPSCRIDRVRCGGLIPDPDMRVVKRRAAKGSGGFGRGQGVDAGAALMLAAWPDTLGDGHARQEAAEPPDVKAHCTSLVTDRHKLPVFQPVRGHIRGVE